MAIEAMRVQIQAFWAREGEGGPNYWRLPGVCSARSDSTVSTADPSTMRLLGA